MKIMRKKNIVKIEELKIIIISQSPITMRDFHRFGAEYLMKKGYDIELWEIRKKNVNIPKYTAKMYIGENLHILAIKDFKKRVKENKKAIFIVYASITSNKDLIRVFAKYQCEYLYCFGLGLLPLVDVLSKTRITFLQRFTTVTNRGIKEIYRAIKSKTKRIYNEILIKYLIIYNPPKYIICSTHETNNRLPSYFNSFRFKYIHSMDYDRYLELEQREEVKKNEYILFCDSGYGSVIGDYTIMDLKDPVYENREYFWEQIEITFQKLEQYYNMPVVIAGHPHTLYDEKSFNGRDIIIGHTEELVKYCKIFVMIETAAVSFAFLYNKEMLILYNNLFFEINNWYRSFHNMTDIYGIKPCNMDSEEMISQPWSYVRRLSNDAREQYINRYIKEKDTPEKLIIEVIEEDILNEISNENNR